MTTKSLLLVTDIAMTNAFQIHNSATKKKQNIHFQWPYHNTPCVNCSLQHDIFATRISATHIYIRATKNETIRTAYVFRNKKHSILS